MNPAARPPSAFTVHPLALTPGATTVGHLDEVLATPPGVLELCTCAGEGVCFACDPDYLDKCAAARAGTRRGDAR